MGFCSRSHCLLAWDTFIYVRFIPQNNCQNTQNIVQIQPAEPELLLDLIHVQTSIPQQYPVLNVLHTKEILLLNNPLIPFHIRLLLS